MLFCMYVPMLPPFFSMLTPMMLAPCLARVSRWGQSERSLQEVSGKSMWSQKVTFVGIGNDNVR